MTADETKPNRATRRAIEKAAPTPVNTALAHNSTKTEKIGEVTITTTTSVNVAFSGPANEVSKLMRDQIDEWDDGQQ